MLQTLQNVLNPVIKSVPKKEPRNKKKSSSILEEGIARKETTSSEGRRSTVLSTARKVVTPVAADNKVRRVKPRKSVTDNAEKQSLKSRKSSSVTPDTKQAPKRRSQASTPDKTRVVKSRKPASSTASVTTPRKQSPVSVKSRLTTSRKSETPVRNRKASETGVKRLQSRSSTVVVLNALNRPRQSKETQENVTSNVTVSKSSLELQRNSTATIEQRKPPREKLPLPRKPMKNLSETEIKPVTRKMDANKENIPQVARSVEVMKPEPVTPAVLDLHEEKMEALRQIVTQAELDRRLFCIFDIRRSAGKFIREELIKRGWEEYETEKGSVLRKNRSSPAQMTTTTATTGDPTCPVNRTEKALILPSGDENNSGLHVTPPIESSTPQKQNQDIYDYGTSWDTILSAPPNKLRRRSPIKYRTPAEIRFMQKFIEENNMHLSFVWLSSKPETQLPHFTYTPDIVNKFQKTNFCSKLGLWFNLKNRRGNFRALRYPIQTPRMYNLGDRQSYTNFIFDFYTTTAESILRWLVFNVTEFGASGVCSVNGRVPKRVFEFSVQKSQLVCKYLNNLATRDEIIKNEISWKNLLAWFYKIVNDQEKMELITTTDLYILHSQAMEVLRALRQIKPESANDGITNLWIVKPYTASCGRGIFVTNNFYYLEQLESKRFIIQKYIERPFLVSGVKFDIRQWFMVTSLSPVQIWIYKECYLRFCSVPFDLRNLHQAVHLTNNAIQKKYAKTVGLPYQNMWDSHTFQRYLRETGNPRIWKERIYPGMRDAVTAAILCSDSAFDTTNLKYPPRSGWFEVYGADFLLTENLREGPWLIEINESPALDPSTPVTARLCPKMIRDVVKVVVDWRKDPKAETGEWELAYSGKEELNE